MTTTQAALLEALTEILDLCAIGDVGESTEALGWGVAIQRARAALLAAEAAQPEPVAWKEALQSLLDAWHAGQLTVRPEAAGYWEAAVEFGESLLGRLDQLRAASTQPAPIAAQAVRGEVPGHGLPDWPADLQTFGERVAYQRGIGDARRIAAQAGTYSDSTPHLSVGDSSFESWFAAYDPWGKGDKQRARDAYAAGMGDPLVVAAQAGPAQAPLTDEQIDALRGLDTASRVRFYEHDFYVLSNFSAFNLERDGLTFPTSEHAYHYEKFATDEMGPRSDVGYEVMTAPSAHEAFKIAERNKHLRRPDWDAVKVGIMLDILRAKAEQHEYVRRKLLDTGDRELVEDSWRDDFWGWGPNRDGKNMLGRLWMQVRAELRADAHNGAQAPASTRPADASISGQRVDMVPSDDDESGFPCPNCQGSGAIAVMSDNGPDAHEVEEYCPHCDGRGSLDAAYEGAVKLLKAQRAETLKLSGKLWGLKHSREAREAFLLEVGEDLARWHDPIGYWKDYAARKAPAAAPQAPAEQPLMLNGLSEAETAQTASVAGLTVAPAEPAAQAVRWQGGLTNGELRAAFQSKLQPSTKFTDDDLTAFALGIEWAEARATPAAREAGTPKGDTP